MEFCFWLCYNIKIVYNNEVFFWTNNAGKGAAKIESTEMENISGEELYRRFLKGDGEAFDGLVALYEDELFRFINGIVSDYHEAKHLMIEAFARLALGGRKYSEKSTLKTYLFAIGKNLALRYVKMRGREQHISYDEVIETLIDDGETPYIFLEQKENKKLLWEAMNELKSEHRAVLILLYFEDMSYIQAGRAMKKTETQIRGLAHRAKKALKKELENNGNIQT